MTTTQGAGRLPVIATVLGVLAAGVRALLTFGAQATGSPDGVPVAVAVAEGSPAQLTQAAGQVAVRGGDQLDVTVTDPVQARAMLADKDVYGVLELGVSPSGPTATVVTSGAVNPQGSQVAQQALTRAGEGLVAAIAQRMPNVTPSPVQMEQVNAVGPAARTAPLAASALAWVGCLVAGAALTAFAMRSGRRVGPVARLGTAVGVGTFVAASLAGFLLLWDSSLPVDDWRVLGMLLLMTLAFAMVQTGLLHLLGLKAMAILAPLYLIAPAVASQVPEMLHPGYRAGLWSWTPFRFPAEALRSLLAASPDAPDVLLAVWVLAGMAVIGLVLLAIPRRAAVPEVAVSAEADKPAHVPA